MGQNACWENVCRLPGLSLCVQRKFCLYPGARTFEVKLVDSLRHFLQKFNLEKCCRRQTFWWLMTSTSQLELSQSTSLKTCFLYSLLPYYYYYIGLAYPLQAYEESRGHIFLFFVFFFRGVGRGVHNQILLRDAQIWAIFESYNVFMVHLNRLTNLEHLVISKVAFFLQLLLTKVTVF